MEVKEGILLDKDDRPIGPQTQDYRFQDPRLKMFHKKYISLHRSWIPAPLLFLMIPVFLVLALSLATIFGIFYVMFSIVRSLFGRRY